MRAWYTDNINPKTGKRQITFKRSNGLVDMELSIPCGKCMGCRVRKTTSWALRCVHESELHDQNCFITLTYNDEHVPQGGTLVKKHFQDFMKRLRESVKPKKIRYYMCGEYGSELGRPHYHALIFGYDFEDKQKFQYRNGSILYTSEMLAKLWPFGFVTIGELNYTTAAYTAQYVTKKIYGDAANEHYQGRLPEYSSMSLGIGRDYVEKYKDELLQHDNVVANGREYPIPDYYTGRLSDEEQTELKLRRKQKLLQDAENNTLERLRVREKVKESIQRIKGDGRNLN